MKTSSLKKFYDSEKELVEITSIVFVVWGLFLNIPKISGVAGTAVGQIKFFLTFASTFLLLYLTYKAIGYFLSPILETAQQDAGKKDQSLEGLQGQVNALVKAIVTTTFIIYMALIFTADLLIYLLSSYIRETIYLVLVMIFYLVFLLYSRKQPNRSLINFGNLHVYVFVAFGLVLMIILPITLFIKMFF